jgi:PAS domain S-box-containing protein
MSAAMTYRRRALLLSAICVYVSVIALVDWLTPLVFDVWVLFLPVVIVPVWFNSSRQIASTAAVCSVLMLIDASLPHPNTPRAFVFGNLAMGLTALWLMALAGITIVKRSRELMSESSSLLVSEERLRLAMEGAGMGTWDRNLRTNQSIWSDTHFRMLGYQPTQNGAASVEMWQSTLHPDDLSRVLEAQEESRTNRTIFNTEYRVFRVDDGKIAWLAVFGRFFYDESGEAVRFLGVSFDITRRKELEREILEIAAQEQLKIGHELHDSVGQELTGLGLMASALHQSLPTTASEQRIIASLSRGLDRVRLQVRNLSRGLVPVQVETKGLWSALDDLVARTRMQAGIQVRFDCPDRVAVLDHDAATQLFHIAQEAVSNALRHGHPRHIDVTLRHAFKGLSLSVQDDGVGLQHDNLQNGDGMGMHIMRYRAEQIGASFHVGHGENGGTIVTCTLLNVKGHISDQHHQEPNLNGSKSFDRG